MRMFDLFHVYYQYVAKRSVGHPRAEGNLRVILLPCLAIGFACVVPYPSAAQEADALSAEELSRDRVFHVEVEATPVSERDKVNRSGKAFAIAPNLFITARHVVGTNAEWERRRDVVSDALAHVVQLPDRKISLTRVKNYSPVEFTPPTDRVFVVPSPSDDLDAVVLSAPDLNIANPYRLSFCDIVVGDGYRAILTERNPTQLDAIGRPVVVNLTARGYRPEKFGSLYVFEPEAGQNFSKELNGSGGAPILDEAGGVVAMVSAVYTDGSTSILATPISAQIPGASSFVARIPRADGQNVVQCSLGQTVRKIYDRVASQYNWSVDVVRTAEGVIDKLIVTYDDPTAETPIPIVKMLPTYSGIIQNFRHSPDTIPDIRPVKDQLLISTASDDSRRYEFSNLKTIGENNYDSASNGIGGRCTDRKCGIKSLRVEIFPQLIENVSPDLVDDGKFLKRPITRFFPWVDPSVSRR